MRGSRVALVALGMVAGAAGSVVAACATSGTGVGPQTGTDASPDSSMQTNDSSSGGGGCDGANLQTDFANCGSCGHVCPTGEICNAAKCQAGCNSPQVICPNQSGCYDLSTDEQNCGACGAVCQAPQGTVIGSPVCTNGFCDFTCPADASTEAGAPIVKCAADAGTPGCFDLTSSPENCGTCGMPCATGDSCTSGQCCTSGSIVCGGACTNVQTSATSCGACDAGCPSPAKCIGGQCTGYVTSNPTEAFLNACSLPGSKAVLPNQAFWAMSQVAPLPFAFTFFGTSETQFWIGSQGTLAFGTPSKFMPPDGYPDCLSTGDPTTAYAAAVAFGDESLATGPNGVCYATIGGAGDAGADAGVDGGAPEQFVVTWSQVYDSSDTGSQLTFSIVLTQGTNTLDFMYQQAAGVDGGIDPTVAGATATVGIQAPSGGTLAYTPYSCGTTFISSTPFDVRFAPAQ
jgi:hypothetical protein